MMLFVTTVFAAILFQWCCKTIAYPPTNNPLHDLTSARRTTPLLFNASTLTLQTGHIDCSPDGDYKTSFAGCRPSFNRIRSFPSYRLRQIFKMDRLPRLPAKPPVVIYEEEADCAIGIACTAPYREDMFSWEQVRAAAMAIAEECEENYGYGGSTPVGQGVGWHVRVAGFRVEIGGMNETAVGEGVDGMASTVLITDG